MQQLPARPAMLFTTEAELFATWRELRPDLVEDGMVDANAYRSSSPRTVFLLKEANDTTRAGRWDLRTYTRDNGKGRTLDNIARWCFAIRNRTSDISWPEVRDLSRGLRVEFLCSIALVNLKKSPGGFVANERAISDAAIGDQDLLRAQMNLYQPQLTVWCGTEGALLHEAPLRWKETRRGIHFAESESGIVLRYSHPSARAADNLLFSWHRRRRSGNTSGCMTYVEAD